MTHKYPKRTMGTPLYGGILSADTKRDLYQVAGLPVDLHFENFYSLFRRNGFAKAGIMRPVQKCWSTYPKIYDFSGDGDPESTGTRAEKDVQFLIDKFDFFKMMYSLDYRQRVGRFGGIAIIANEIDGQSKKSIDPIRVAGVKSLIALRPLYEGQLKEGDVDDNIQSANFGNPKSYTFHPNQASTSTKAVEGNATLDKSRVFVFAEGADDGSIYGTPALEAGFNHIMNLFKVEVAASEGLYKNARQRLHVNVKDQELASFGGINDNDQKEGLNEAIMDFAASFDNELFTSGMEVKVLQAAIADPAGPANVCLQAYCTAMEIPKTVLIGFETGERSSSENKSAWNEAMNSRRENVCTPMIIGMLNHMVDIGALAPPKYGWKVVWDDLNEATDMERIDKSQKLANVNKTSIDSGLGEVYSLDEIREAGGYDPEDADFLDDLIGGETDGQSTEE